MEHNGSTPTLPPLPETGDDLVDDKQIRAFVAAPGIVEHHSPFSDSSRDIWDAIQVECWRFVKPLGRGGFGQVHLEEKVYERFPQPHPAPQMRAVKIVPDRTGGIRATQYLPEILGMAKFSKLGASFVQLFSWFQIDSDICIAMEWARYGDLEECVRDSLPEEDAREITRQVASAVVIMHERRFLHRDLKPRNVFVFKRRPDSNEWRVKLGDFGVSKRVHAAANTSWHTSIDADCSAPEVLGLLGGDFTEESSYANPVDMWSLGYLAHWLLTRQYPVSRFALPRLCMSMTPITLDHLTKTGVSKHAVDFVQRLLHLEPSSRMTATEAFQHPWLNQRHESSDPTSKRSVALNHVQRLSRDTLISSSEASYRYGVSEAHTDRKHPGQRYDGQLLGPDDLQHSPNRPGTSPSEMLPNDDGLLVQAIDIDVQNGSDMMSTNSSAQVENRSIEFDAANDQTPLFPRATNVDVSLMNFKAPIPSTEDYRLAAEYLSRRNVHSTREKDESTGKKVAETFTDGEALVYEETQVAKTPPVVVTETYLDKDLRTDRESGAEKSSAEPDNLFSQDDKLVSDELAIKVSDSKAETRHSLGKQPLIDKQQPAKRASVANPAPDTPENELLSSEDLDSKLVTFSEEHQAEREPPSSGLNTLEFKVLDNFKKFSNHTRQQVAERRRARTREDKEAKLNDLLQFSKTFKLTTPIPTDMVGILAKDPAKQDDLVDRAQKNADEARLNIQEIKKVSAQRPTDLGATSTGRESPRKAQGRSREMIIDDLRKWHSGLNPQPAQKADTKTDSKFCLCNNSMKYGELVACDNQACRRKWFHLSCLGLDSRPMTPHWLCDECSPANSHQKVLDSSGSRDGEGSSKPQQASWAQIASLKTPITPITPPMSSISTNEQDAMPAAAAAGLPKKKKRRPKQAAKPAAQK